MVRKIIARAVSAGLSLALISLNAFAYDDSLLDAVAAVVEEQNLSEVARIHELLALPYQAMPERFVLRLRQAEALPEAAQGLDQVFYDMAAEAEGLFRQGDPAALQVQQGSLQFAQELFGPRHWFSALALEKLSLYLLQLGQTEQATRALDQAYEIASEQLGADHPSSIAILLAGNRIQLKFGNIKAALDILNLAAEQYADALGPAHDMWIAARLLQVDLLTGMNEWSQARDVLAPVCQVQAQSRSRWHPNTLSCRRQEASLLAALGQEAEAELVMQENLELSIAALGEKSSNSLDTMLELAELERGRGDFRAARERLEQVLQLTELGGSYWLMAKNYLIRVYTDEGSFQAAVKLINELLPTAKAYWNKDPVNYYSMLMEKARLQQQLGLLGEAENTFRQTLTGLKKEVGEAALLTVIAGSNLGQLYEQMGLFDEAEPLLKTALDQFVRIQGVTSPDASRARSNLALLFEGQGNFREAEPLYLQSYELLSEKYGPAYNDAVAIQNNLAFLYMLMQDFARAEAQFVRVVDNWTNSLGRDHPRRLKALNNLGRVQLNQNRLVEAEQTLLSALTIRKSKLGDRHPDVIRSMIDLGKTFLAQERLAEADTLLTDTVKLSEAVLGDQHPYTFDAINSLAATKQMNNQLNEAIELRQQGFLRRSLFLDRMLWITGENAREGYLRLYRQEFDDYLALLALVGGSENAKRALQLSLHRKGLLLKITSEIQQIGRMSLDPKLADLAIKLRQSRESLATLTLSGPTTDTAGRHPQALYELEQRVNELQGELGRASVQYRSSIAPLDVDKLEQAVTSNKALVDFLAYSSQGQHRYVASVLVNKAGRVEYHLIDFPDGAQIDQGIAEYRDVIQDLSVEDEELFEYGQDSYAAIWQPVEAVLEGLDYVYLIPDGLLNILPFTALVTASEEYLVQSVDLHILTSGRDLLPSYFTLSEGKYLMFAGPDYDSSEVINTSLINDLTEQPVSTSLTVRGAGSGLRGLRFVPLPGAEKEGQIIVDKVMGSNIPIDSFTKAAAQELVINQLTETPSILHIASHGFFLRANENLKKRLLKLQRGSELQIPPPGDNPLLRAGLAFAGVNTNAPFLGRIDTQNDGILTALEVLDLRLSGTKLVVLSACETGLGEIHEGEGVYGLRRAFQEAGVAEIVSSLWEVSDAGTQALMTGFYDKMITGTAPRDALRQVQLELIESSEWSYPYVWSAFMMVGSYESAGIKVQ